MADVYTEEEYPDFTSQDEMSSVTLILEEQKLYVHREVLAAWSPVFKSMFTRDFKDLGMADVYTEEEYPDFTSQDEMSSVTLILEEQKLYVHREVLAAWSPVFKSMFTRDFKEKESTEIELPDKKVDDFVELLHCMYPPIKPVTDTNVYQLLPLAEEYQIMEVKKKCEEYLLTKSGSMELLITAQLYNLSSLLGKCIEYARTKSFTELQKDPNFVYLQPVNLISILSMRVQDLEDNIEQNKKAMSERDARLYGCINELISGYGSFCTDCKSRKVNESCFNCLKMYRDKVKLKCEEARQMRNHNMPHFKMTPTKVPSSERIRNNSGSDPEPS